MLQAFLAFSIPSSVYCGASLVCSELTSGTCCKSTFQDYQPSKDWMASFWMETVL